MLNHLETLRTGQYAPSGVGANGFGYDPLFWVPDYGCSSAELAPEVKNSLSHRGQALRQLALMLQKLVQICFGVLKHQQTYQPQVTI
jgi:inosine/xanthosine triphosphate pyrophosphatase family protein